MYFGGDESRVCCNAPTYGVCVYEEVPKLES
jgi:hypothetical protein